MFSDTKSDTSDWQFLLLLFSARIMVIYFRFDLALKTSLPQLTYRMHIADDKKQNRKRTTIWTLEREKYSNFLTKRRRMDFHPFSTIVSIFFRHVQLQHFSFQPFIRIVVDVSSTKSFIIISKITSCIHHQQSNNAVTVEMCCRSRKMLSLRLAYLRTNLLRTEYWINLKLFDDNDNYDDYDNDGSDEWRQWLYTRCQWLCRAFQFWYLPNQELTTNGRFNVYSFRMALFSSCSG